ncbi:hypothetical protein LMG31506_03034 [Cupriavidus yeoncheonensis]|uniref:Uncharacterized protein n=1 Tax=Cupriavidus yeoncheonensis TaxID=1462994 RepID=A0A916IUI0_9BURK|nr:hypothetical protein [Cupriavidus yeoncheonensis]CAG2144565.1 hypothetical protein LMG31506_03034 [Cupriavidus yeoncheonensis]
MKSIGIVGAIAAAMAGAAQSAGQIVITPEAIASSGPSMKHLAFGGPRTRSRIPGRPRPAGSKLARAAKYGRCTLPRGRRGLIGHQGRVAA